MGQPVNSATVPPFCPIMLLAAGLWAERPGATSWNAGNPDARAAYILFARSVVASYFMGDQIAGNA